MIKILKKKTLLPSTCRISILIRQVDGNRNFYNNNNSAAGGGSFAPGFEPIQFKNSHAIHPGIHRSSGHRLTAPPPPPPRRGTSLWLFFRHRGRGRGGQRSCSYEEEKRGASSPATAFDHGHHGLDQPPNGGDGLVQRRDERGGDLRPHLGLGHKPGGGHVLSVWGRLGRERALLLHVRRL